MPFHQTDWMVLLIGGSSGVGKTMVAKQLGLCFDASWLQVDDVRLAFQRSRVTLAERTAALYFFLETPHIWTLPPERLRDGLIEVGQVLSPALEVVIENHVDTAAPIVIEGEGVLPSLYARSSVRDRARTGQVQAVFLVEPEEDVVFANLVARGRGMGGQSEAELRTEARAKWLYGQWLADGAHRHNLPVLASRPWPTLVERIMAATSARALHCKRGCTRAFRVIFLDSETKCRCKPWLVNFRGESRSKQYHVTDNFFLPGNSVVQ